jgi:uncharacterized protein (TIGR00730 family)
MLRRVAVFAGSGELSGPDELAAAQRVGRLLGENGIALIYDGSAVGTGGVVAEAAAVAGGRLIGVTLPTVAGPLRDDLTERRVAGTITDWQTAIAAMTDAWLGLPGGFRSLDDALAVWTWGEPSLREQPLGLLDDADYYSQLLRDATDAVVDRFIVESQRGRVIVSKSAAELLRRMAHYRPPETRRDQPVNE